ncbi:MAG: iron-containing alcohol dehydrogenase [Candidatus Bathyarchaeota archaeon]|nr:MAG: iron-containing alcohol dehydrogenase [Candidatus Bathyarchaeota archaeon]
MWELTFPRTIVLGDGALEYLENIEGQKALIITDKIIQKLGFVERVAGHLAKAGLAISVFDDVEPEPCIETIMQGAKVARRFEPDWIIGLGGGSCMDAAKAIWVVYANPDIEVEEINPFASLGLRERARLICISTTSGSGSEATWAAIITDTKNEMKLELPSRELVADVAIIDPELPRSMSQELRAHTGLDVLAHAVEAYVSQWSNDFTDALALRAIQFVFTYLLRAYKNPNDKEAREKMHNAATMAGMAFSNSQVGVAHAMGHSLGIIFNIYHGKAVGILLPYSMEFSAIEARHRYAEIARAVGIEARVDEDATEKLIKELRQLNHQLGEPSSIKELGINKEDFEKRLDDLIKRAASSTGVFVNPRVPSTEDLRRLFLSAYNGDRVEF